MYAAPVGEDGSALVPTVGNETQLMAADKGSWGKPAYAPLFILKQPRTGSSWLGNHLKDLGSYYAVSIEANDAATKKYGNHFHDNHGHDNQHALHAYCEEVTDHVMSVLMGATSRDHFTMLSNKDAPWGAVGLFPFNGGDLNLKQNGKVDWRCLAKIEKRIKRSIKKGEMVAPRLVVLTRRNVVSQGLSSAKAKDMEAKHKCSHPYTERDDECTERFWYKWKQDPADLLDLVQEKVNEAQGLRVVAQRLKKSWGLHSVNYVQFEDMLNQAEGHGLALTHQLTKLIGAKHENGATAKKDRLNKVAKHRGMSPREQLKNYREVLAYFEENAPWSWVHDLKA